MVATFQRGESGKVALGGCPASKLVAPQHTFQRSPACPPSVPIGCLSCLSCPVAAHCAHTHTMHTAHTHTGTHYTDTIYTDTYKHTFQRSPGWAAAYPAQLLPTVYCISAHTVHTHTIQPHIICTARCGQCTAAHNTHAHTHNICKHIETY